MVYGADWTGDDRAPVSTNGLSYSLEELRNSKVFLALGWSKALTPGQLYAIEMEKAAELDQARRSFAVAAIWRAAYAQRGGD